MVIFSDISAFDPKKKMEDVSLLEGDVEATVLRTVHDKYSIRYSIFAAFTLHSSNVVPKQFDYTQKMKFYRV